MKNQYRGSQNIISEKKVSLDKGFYRGASHNGFKFEKLKSIQGHDSFLVDEKNFSKVIYNFFND